VGLWRCQECRPFVDTFLWLFQWPYTYDSCDVGTAPNQTRDGLPLAATVNGDTIIADGALSYLPGQRLSRCTCPGESHPGPVHADGTYVGRAAPEIDIFEAQVRFSHILKSCHSLQADGRFRCKTILGQYPSLRSGR